MSGVVVLGSGVLRGTVLGQLLFLIYINDLPSVLSTNMLVIFANDFMIYWMIQDELDQTVLQKNLDALHHWSVFWGMQLNTKNVTQYAKQDLRFLYPICILSVLIFHKKC